MTQVKAHSVWENTESKDDWETLQSVIDVVLIFKSKCQCWATEVYGLPTVWYLPNLLLLYNSLSIVHFQTKWKASELELYPLNNLSIHSCFCSLECKVQEFLDTWLTSPPWETGATGCFDKTYHKTLDKERRCWCCSSGITCTRSQTNTTFYRSSPAILSNSIC